ncbi:Cytochrome c [Stratiformator vulcanicus]|uniref:Cytochrome c n=2 Tax=Stratiformator vulcanicus TaxID=2527980 RepID=A0A517R2Z1_9PLAN|nr:Cytochrome c [Stratiformator vulcanicus]
MHRPEQLKDLSVFASLAVLLVACSSATCSADDAASAAERGYRTLRTKAFLPNDFDDSVFKDLWKQWPEPDRSKAETATEKSRLRMIRDRYGLHQGPEDDSRLLGWVPTENGGHAMNCFACHGGAVDEKVIPGLANTELDLAALVRDVRATKLAKLKPLSHLDLAQLNLPLGGSRGTTNAVIFGVILDGIRNPDMSVDTSRDTRPHVHHFLDAPAWWNLKKKSRLYYDGFAPKNHRMLVQFTLIPKNDRETIYSWEDDFRDILAYIESIEPPKFPYEIDRKLAGRGQVVFENNCAECHGTYGDDWTYQERVVPIDDLGTDRVRFDAMTTDHRAHLSKSWMSRYGKDEVIPDPAGYIAPPLDGIWASAPYLHNGSVPTLWHLLHPEERPKVWRRKSTKFNREQVGFKIESFDSIPAEDRRTDEKREYVDTTKFGYSADGHDYPSRLSENEKVAVLEYLKTL